MKKTNQGFTLIEFILYSAILVVVLSVFLNFIWDVIYGNIKAQAIREVQQNGRLAMEKIIRTIQESSLINSPIPGESANILSLQIEEHQLNPTVFELIGHTLVMRQRNRGPYDLTNNRMVIDSLKFTNLSYERTPGTIRIEMTLSHLNDNNQAEYDVSQDFVSTVSLFEGGAIPSQ